MDMNENNRVINLERYSGLKHLQKKIKERCDSLPQNFDTLQEWKVFKKGMLEKLRCLLPLWEVKDKSPHVEMGKSELGDDLLHETVDVCFDEYFYIPVHVYRLKKDGGKKPAVIVCPGFGAAKNSQDNVDLCIALARNGILALAMEYAGTGECSERPDPETDINNVTALGQLLGINNVGLRVMNNMAALDYLKSRTDVDSGRIGVTGLCQGAIITWFTSSLCDEFVAAAPVCGVSTYQAVALEYCNRQGGWTGISPYVFGLLEIADVQHIVSAIAPRHLLVQNNLTDKHWPLSGFYRAKQMTEKVYGLYGASDNCTFHLEHAPHSYSGPLLEKTVAWFSKVL